MGERELKVWDIARSSARPGWNYKLEIDLTDADQTPWLTQVRAQHYF